MFPNMSSRCSHLTLEGKRCKKNCTKDHRFFCNIHQDFVQKEIDKTFQSYEKCFEEYNLQISEDVLSHVLQPFFGEKFSDFFSVGDTFVVRGGIEVYTGPYGGHGYELTSIVLENVSSCFYLILENPYFLKLLDDKNHSEDEKYDEYMSKIFEYEKSGDNWSQVRICPYSNNIQFFKNCDTRDVILHNGNCFAEIIIDVENECMKNIKQFCELSEKILEFYRNPESKTVSYTKTISRNGQVEIVFQ